MITIFNRKELLMTFDMQKQGVVRRMLVELSLIHIYHRNSAESRISALFFTGQS